MTDYEIELLRARIRELEAKLLDLYDVLDLGRFENIPPEWATEDAYKRWVFEGQAIQDDEFRNLPS